MREAPVMAQCFDVEQLYHEFEQFGIARVER
jgi:hypothetical protein